MNKKLTEKANRVLEVSREIAVQYHNDYIKSEHLLFGLLVVEDSLSKFILEKYINVEMILKYFDKKDTVVENVVYSKKVQKIIDNAIQLAEQLHFKQVGTEHLLISLLKEVVKGVYILLEENIDVDKIIKDVYNEIGLSVNERGEIIDKRNTVQPNQTVLNTLTYNLTKQAERGEVGNIIGRDLELERILQILSRKTKNNPILVGEAGVGKTSVAYAVAHYLATNEQLPNNLKNKIILGLDVGSLVAGTKYRGEFEERLKKLVEELIVNKNVILFIDEIHMLIGAGAGEGSMDAANILKPALSRGDIQVIGATTYGEYQKYIEKDAALERRFAPVQIEEPTREVTVKMLEHISKEFELYHEVNISKEVIEYAVDLSIRYISDRKLPDKAIDLLDEACAKLKLTQKATKAENITQLLIDGKLKAASRAFKKEQHQNQTQNDILQFPPLTKQKIAEIVSLWSGVPVSELEKSETKKLLNLEKDLHKRVIGQNDAVVAISKAIRRSRSGVGDSKKPIGSFLFLGPTGVGKTELAKALAELLFGSEDKMIRVDMSEFMEKHSTSRLIGAPPGYVGFDEGGQLTERVRKNPYSVILFDEMEKAHPDVFNVLLQILDDGYVSDTKGRKIDFKNTIIIMTSNLGATALKDEKTVGFNATRKDNHAVVEKTIREELKKAMRPEFINRLDEIIVFKSLEQVEIQNIVKLMIKDVIQRLSHLNISWTITPNVYKKITLDGFSKEYGARPLKRLIQKEIEDQLSELLLKQDIKEYSAVKISVHKNKINIDVNNDPKV